jgi:hypothetical protein
MKIVLDVPDWAAERHIYIFAGIELLGYKLYGSDDVYVKTDRCNLCGKCCRNLPKSGNIPTDDENTCIYLTKVGSDYICSLGTARPWQCSWSDPVMTRSMDSDICCIKYKCDK